MKNQKVEIENLKIENVKKNKEIGQAAAEIENLKIENEKKNEELDQDAADGQFKEKEE